MNLVVTGSSAGIGRALVTQLIARGHSVWGLARSDQADLRASLGPLFHSTRCDVSDWTQIDRASREVGATWKHVDGLVTCAGIHGEIGRAVDADPLRWSTTVRANLDGTYFAIRALHALLRQAPRRAKIACFSGGGATKARARFSAYGAAKCAIVRLVETIAEEEKSQPLDINAVAPGAIPTRLTEEIISLGPSVVGEAEFESARHQKELAGSPLARAIELVEWLLSQESDGVTGRLISAQWDPWASLGRNLAGLSASDVYMLRRILPEDRGVSWKA